VVPWSRILDSSEILCAFNTDPHQSCTAWVTLDEGLHAAGDALTCRYSTDAAQIGTTTTISARNGKAVLLTLPPAGFVIFE